MFEKLIGNDHIKVILRRLLRNRRLPNAFLFAGPEGVGKRQFALELAAALVCREAIDGEACGACSACRRAMRIELPSKDKTDDFKRVIFSGHPDVGMVAAPNRMIYVDAIRDLEKEANFRAYEASARFFIIDDAHKMNDAASNALLKTLEEPPNRTYILLITSRPDRLLPTIRSRTQVLRFAPAAYEEIEAHLAGTGRFTAEDARLASRISGGSIGRAANTDVEALHASRDKMLAVLESAARTHDIAALLQASETLADAKNKDRFETDLEMLNSLVRDAWAARIGCGRELLLHTDIADKLSRIAENVPSDTIANWLEGIEKLKGELAVNINKRVAVDALLVNMAAG